MIDGRRAAQRLFLAGAYYTGTVALAERFLSGAGSILMLHRVNNDGPSPLSLNTHLVITPHFLDQLLTDVKRRGLALVSLDEMLEGLAANRKGMIALTLDDGWYDNYTDALPVFEAHDAPFTVYVSPGLVSGEVQPWWEVIETFVANGGAWSLPGWNERDPVQLARRICRHIFSEMPEVRQQEFMRDIGAIEDPPPRRFMSWDELRELSAHPLGALGAHTVHHYNLKRLDESLALDEMIRSADLIEQETGKRPQHFAYPYGFEAAVGAREVQLASQVGFRSAVTTRHGVLQASHRNYPHALPRISVNGNFQRLAYMRTLLSGLTTSVANYGRRVITL